MDSTTTTPAAAYLADIPQSLALAAHQGTSFNPEKRAVSLRSEYATTIAQDRETLLAMATKGGTLHLLETEFTRYREGYARRFRAYLASSSRCVSWFIVGPSKFPTARMNKRADVAHRRLDEMLEYRRRALKAIRSTLRPDLKPIMAGDADALERLQLKLAKLTRNQEYMRAANAAIRKAAKQGRDTQIVALVELGFSDTQANQLLTPDFGGRIGFPDYALTNNNANIRRIEKRVKEVEARAGWVTNEVEDASGVTVREDVEANRVMLYFPSKPDVATRKTLKANGFKWSPPQGAWQRYLNAAGQAAARAILESLQGDKSAT